MQEPSPRTRLLGGMLEVVTTKGYAATTIADIVKAASVSKRTFYEHFADKEACFLASYQLLSDRTLEAVASAANPAHAWDRQVCAAVSAYVDLLALRPDLARVFMLEVYAAGPAAIAMQRETHARFATMLRDLVTAGRENNPEIAPLGQNMAAAVVGGINELVVVALTSDDTDLLAIGPTITKLVSAVLAHG